LLELDLYSLVNGVLFKFSVNLCVLHSKEGQALQGIQTPTKCRPKNSASKYLNGQKC